MVRNTVPVDVDPKDVRVRKGLTQQDFAQLLGVSLSTVQRWEKGKTRPSRLARQRMRQIGGSK